MSAGEPHAAARRYVDRGDIVAGVVDFAERVVEIGARRAEPRLALRDFGLHHAAIGEPHHTARRLPAGELDERVEHAAREAERHRGNPDRVHRLLRELVEPARLAPQLRVLAGRTEFLGHEQIVHTVRIRGRAAQADRVPGIKQGRLLDRKQPGAEGRSAKAVEPQRAVGLDDAAVRAHPARMTAAARKAPLPGHAISARRRLGDAVVGRTPGAGRTRGAENLARDLTVEIGRDERCAVGDRQAPANRAVMARRRLDHARIGDRIDLVTADRQRQQHAEQACVVQPGQQRLRNAPRPLDRVRRFEDGWPQLADAAERIDQRRAAYHIVHTAPCWRFEPVLRTRRAALSMRHADWLICAGWSHGEPR
jgi:hypothetical protein